MTRSMLYSRAMRGFDGDAGGAAELQTDVMRFIAILSLCLVAIFALVQSIPEPPEVQPVTAEAAVEPPPVVAETAAPDVATPVEPPREVLISKPVEMPPPRSAEVPAAEPVVEQPPVETPMEMAPEQQQETEGFTLQFETDAALTALVARNEVALFAISGNSARKLSLLSGQSQFHVASVPSQFHEMDSGTVPADVQRALRLSGYRANKWGVTLPPAISAQLNALISRHSGGKLVIDAGGQLRLEAS